MRFIEFLLTLLIGIGGLFAYTWYTHTYVSEKEELKIIKNAEKKVRY